MRIRKGRSSAAAAAVPLLCHLNQSPWDVYDVPSSPPPSPCHDTDDDPQPLLPLPPSPPLLPSPFPLDCLSGQLRFFAKRTANVVGADERYAMNPPPSPCHDAAHDPQALIPRPPPPRPSPFPFPQFDPLSGRWRVFAKRTAANVVGADERGKKTKKTKKKKSGVDRSNGDRGSVDDEAVVNFKEDDDELVLCPKMDKKGWQCGAVVQKGSSFCDNHLSATFGKRASSRISVPAYSDEFCYYSGFGPRWGKKRG